MSLACGACAAPVRSSDDACGSCGAALARLVVKDGRQRIDDPARVARGNLVEIFCSVENHGVVDGAFVVRRIDARFFPPWLVETPALDVAVTVPAGGAMPLRFVVDRTRLPRAGQSSDENPGRVVVPLITNVVRWDNTRGGAIRKVLAVELAIGGRAALHPAHARYRFLPIERLQGAGLRHVIVVENDGGHALRLTDIHLGAQGVLPVISLIPQLLPIEIPAGARHEVVVLLRSIDAAAAALALQDGPVAGGALVTCTFDDGEQKTADFDFVVGFGPDVVVVDVPVVHTGGRPRRLAITVKNPGHRDVTLESVAIVAGSIQHGVDDGAWLRPVSDDNGVILAAGASRRLDFIIEPEARSGRALEQPWGEKRLRLRHDGWQVQAAEREREIVVTAELGRTRTLDDACLGVDFGTSNSSVSVFHGPTGTLHALPLDRESGRESLSSLMFFTGLSASAGNVDGFLFGAAAENAAPSNFTNLVRQLKSVVARAPDTEWNFVDEGGESSSAAPESRRVQVHRKSTPELLARFFLEMKRRSEDGLRALPLPFLAELGLIDTGVRFRHAVFSHPVGVDEAMIRALHVAAKAVGLADNDQGSDQDFDKFKNERCVDEALAATLAWIYLAASLSSAEVPLVDDERILCFDAGGGTCDVAAVQVKGLKRFRQDPSAGAVDVILLANGGDPRFGGTDVDRTVATWLLKELQKRPEGAAVDVDSLARALFYPSYEAWRRARGETGRSDAARTARALFHKASDVLRAAERIKKTLSEEPSAQWVVSLDDWPGVAPRGQSPGQPRRVEVAMTRPGFEALLAEPFDKAAGLIDVVVDNAGWAMADVTTLLFTGQTSKIPALRKAVLARLMARRGQTPPPFIVEPGRVAGFDVKRCVAQGAAILGDSRRGGGGWLKVSRRSQTALSAGLQTRRGPLLVDVKGLEAGAVMPARGAIAFGEPTTRLVLYRNGTPAFEAAWDVAAAHVEVEVRSENVVVVHVHDGTGPEGNVSAISEARKLS